MKSKKSKSLLDLVPPTDDVRTHEMSSRPIKSSMSPMPVGTLGSTYLYQGKDLKISQESVDVIATSTPSKRGHAFEAFPCMLSSSTLTDPLFSRQEVTPLRSSLSLWEAFESSEAPKESDSGSETVGSDLSDYIRQAMPFSSVKIPMLEEASEKLPPKESALWKTQVGYPFGDRDKTTLQRWEPLTEIKPQALASLSDASLYEYLEGRPDEWSCPKDLYVKGDVTWVSNVNPLMRIRFHSGRCFDKAQAVDYMSRSRGVTQGFIYNILLTWSGK